MHRRHFLAALAAATLAANASSGHEYRQGALEIGHPYAVETAATAKTGAGYLAITNRGTVPDRLLAIRTGFPRAEIHATETDTEGVARMHAIEALDIPAGTTVTLAPQGLHVMFMGLTAPLTAGAGIPATLVFERAGEIDIEFKVEPRTAGAGDEMPGMTH
jgi:copper(I)-binding protein